MSVGQLLNNNSLKHSYELVMILAEKEIKTRYKKNIFGYLWSISNPLAYTLIFYFAFEVVLKISEPNYTLFLITGLFIWQWISNYLGGSTLTFIQNTQLIKKASFPRYLIPLTTCLQDAFHFLVSIPILIVFMFLYKVDFHPEIFLAIPLNFFVTFIFLFGLADISFSHCALS
ncbi:MAG: ABC transporter permease [Bdellovibrionales bacterium]